MIQKTFLFLPRVGIKKEQAFWKQGIRDWDDFIKAPKIKGVSKKTKVYYDRMIIRAKQALLHNASFFSGRIPLSETWRLYSFYKEDAVFLDIETSSAVSKESYLTVIGLFDGFETKVMVRNINLDIEKLGSELRNYKMIVTFNGSTFDLPYLKRKFPGMIPNIPHIDLRHLCNRCGLKGGLKQVEEQLGIKRMNIIVERLYGGDPYKLWKMFKATGDRYYLNLLVEYNEEDVINLKTISEHVVSMLIKQLPIS